MKIAEIFPSLQGEGKNQGKPCLFIRLAGCNLRCRWCDTPASTAWGEGDEHSTPCQNRSGDPIFRMSASREANRFCRERNLSISSPSSTQRGVVIDIETNGTLDFYPFPAVCTSICMDVKCPSSGEVSDLSLLAKIRPEDSVKFVVKDEADCRYAQEVMTSAPDSRRNFLLTGFWLGLHADY